MKNDTTMQARFAETQERFGEMASEICRDTHHAKSRQISANLGKPRLLVDFRPKQSENRLLSRPSPFEDFEDEEERGGDQRPMPKALNDATHVTM